MKLKLIKHLFVPVLIFSLFVIPGDRVEAAQVRIYLTNTAATTWTVPSDWNSANNTIEVIGGGSGGGGGGGGGGAYSKITNATLTAGGSVTIQVGDGGASGVSGEDTYLCNSTSNCASIGGSAVIVGAKGGSIVSGGDSASGVGTVKYGGGNAGTNSTFSGGAGGGGGAAGTLGAGGAGGSADDGSGNGGAGGGGANTGSAGQNNTGLNGTNGGTNRNSTGAGSGGGWNGGGLPTAGTDGGGGGGVGYISSGQAAGAGGAGTEWDVNYGSGGGGGGDASGAAGGGAGGLYGGGGGGDKGNGGGAGAQGIIVITYYPKTILSKPVNNLGLTAYWSFNEGVANIAHDFSGNGNNGTLTNSPTWSTGRLGKALAFDGGDDYIQIPDAVFGNYPTSGNTSSYDRTFSVWFKTTTGGVILGQTDGAAPNTTPSAYVPVLYIANSGTAYGSMFWHNSTTNQNVSSSGYNDGKWHHLVNTYASGGLESLYIDGSLVDSQTQDQYGYTGDYSYFLGTGFGNTWAGLTNAYNYFNGSLDEMRVYNRSLSLAEVTTLYRQGQALVGGNETTRLTDGLVGYWPFNGKDVSWTSGTAGTAYDRSGLGNDGALTNMTQSTAVAQGRMGQAISFDGADDYVSVADNSNLDLTADFTIATWFKTISVDALDGIYAKGSGAVQLSFGGFGGPQGFTICNNQVTCPFADQGTYTPGVWQHVAATRQGNNWSLYVNGEYIMSTTNSTSIGNTSASLVVGYDNAASGRYFNGYFDDYRIYNRALSATEIKQLYNLSNVKTKR